MSFVCLLVLGAFGIAGSVGAAVQLVLLGAVSSVIRSLALSLVELSLAVAGTLYLLYRLDLGTGSIKRRIKAFEVGWRP